VSAHRARACRHEVAAEGIRLNAVRSRAAFVDLAGGK